MTPAREKAKAIIDKVPKRDVISKGADHDLFKQLTNTSHEVMKADWDKGGIMTACNGFTGFYSFTLGRPGLGVFDLPTVGGSAFIKCENGAKPKFGDVFRMKKLHVGVCVECTDTSWEVIEAGQGGKSTGHDILRRSVKPFNPGEVLGWVDIDIWLDPAEQAKDATRKALKGTWNVEVNGSKRAYTFPAAGRDVSYLDKGRKVTGSWDTDGRDVVLKWSTGVTEFWPMPVPPLYKPSQGTWKDPVGQTGVVSYRHAW